MKSRRFRIILLAFATSQIAAAGEKADLPTAKEFKNSVGMKFVRIEPGTFVMGEGKVPPRSRAEWEQRDADESPAHQVQITRPYHLGACEVTNASATSMATKTCAW